MIIVSDKLFYGCFEYICLHNNFKAMTDLKIKLNDIVSQKQVRERKLGPLYCLNNSFKRSTFLDSSAPKYPSLPYQCKLPSINYSRRDISHMLKYLLKKEQMNIPDRNLIRRILVGIFDEELIHAGSKEFINHIEMLQGKESDTLTPSAKMFYMLLKGSITVRTEGIQYRKEEGQTFGQLQIMAGIEIEAIYFQKSSFLITMSEQNFRQYFLPRFHSKYADRQAELLCLAPFLNSVKTFNKYLFLSKYQTKTFNLGDKIIDKGDALQSIYVVADKLKGQGLRYLSKGCLGLSQLQKGKDTYFQTVYCPENEMKFPVFRKEDFQRYILDAMGQSVLLQNSSCFQSTLLNTALSMQDPQKKINNFMRIRNVRLGTSKRVKTESTYQISIQFKFLKDTRESLNRTTNKKILTEQSPQARHKINSCSVRSKPPKSCFLK